MSAEGNNISGEIIEFRDEYFTEERKNHFNKLIKKPLEIRVHERLLGHTAERLYKNARGLLPLMNSNRYDYEEMEELEYEFTHYLAAISELIAIKESELTK